MFRSKTLLQQVMSGTDIPMLQEAHIGVAMKNAKDEVKACADYVTQHTNNESGIAEVIEKFLLSES